jgi:C1A family cysteine protease
MSKTFNVLLSIFGIGFVVMLVVGNQSKKEREQEDLLRLEQEQKRFSSLSPEMQAKELAQREKLKKEAAEKAEIEAKKAEAEKQTRSIALLGAKSLKASMKDPDTFEIKDVIHMEDGSICYTYRAKNSFNAMLQGNAVVDTSEKEMKILVSGRDGNKFVSVWNKHCAKKSGKDLTDIAKIAIGQS